MDKLPHGATATAKITVKVAVDIEAFHPSSIRFKFLVRHRLCSSRAQTKSLFSVFRLRVDKCSQLQRAWYAEQSSTSNTRRCEEWTNRLAVSRRFSFQSMRNGFRMVKIAIASISNQYDYVEGILILFFIMLDNVYSLQATAAGQSIRFAGLILSGNKKKIDNIFSAIRKCLNFRTDFG